MAWIEASGTLNLTSADTHNVTHHLWTPSVPGVYSFYANATVAAGGTAYRGPSFSIDSGTSDAEHDRISVANYGSNPSYGNVFENDGEGVHPFFLQSWPDPGAQYVLKWRIGGGSNITVNIDIDWFIIQHALI